jgi:ABC-2 type transport system permease protein
MRQIIQAEFLKLIYLRSTWIYFLVAALFGALNTVATGLAIDSGNSGFGFPNTETTIGVDSVYSNAAGSYVFALIIGILMITSEFKHGTAIATFLVTPKRNRVLIAKIVMGAIAGLFVQLVAFLVAVAAATIYLATQPNAADPTTSKLLSILMAALLSGAVLGIVGIGIGALIKNQAIAITGSLIWLFLVEPILITFAPAIGKYLLSGAVTGMLNIDFGPNNFNFNSDNFLSPELSTLLLFGYAIAFAFLAARMTLRRDIE